MTGLGLIEVQSADEDPVPVRIRWSEYVLYFRWNSLVAEDWKRDTGP